MTIVLGIWLASLAFFAYNLWSAEADSLDLADKRIEVFNLESLEFI